MRARKTNQTESLQSDSGTQNLSDTPSHRFPYTDSSRGRDPRQVRSAEALRGALLRLLEQKAFDQITIKEITAEAGVHNATFFRHHTAKESLLDHVAADEIDRLVAFSMRAGYGPAGYRALCEYVLEHRTLWRALLTGGAGSAMREEYMRVSKAVAADYSEADGWLPRELGVICSTTLIVETISWWLSQKDDSYSANQIARILNELVTSAVARPAPKVRKARRKSTQ